MKNDDVIRAWTDPEFRDSLSAADRAALPSSPAGLIRLSDGALDGVVGGVDAPLDEEVGADDAAMAEAAFTKSLRTLFGSRKQTCCPIW